MYRVVRLLNTPLGPIQIAAIGEDASGTWNAFSELRQKLPDIADMLPKIPFQTWDHGLRGLYKPLTDALGRPPYANLIKVPYQVCGSKDTCQMYSKSDCHVQAKGKILKMCFTPNPALGISVTEEFFDLIRLWRENFYVVVILPPPKV